VGKKHLWAIISERKVKPFSSFKDIRERVPLLPDPEKMVVKRVLEEIEGDEKYRIFVPKAEKARPGFHRRPYHAR
jgi:putative nucleotide binding protein